MSTHVRNIALAVLVLSVSCGLLLTNCAPPKKSYEAKSGEFLADSNKYLDFGNDFDITATVKYPETINEGLINTDQFVTDRQLTEWRCTWCHECGFKQAFDLEHYNAQGWAPIYRGELWRPIVTRMTRIENSLLNEVLAERIYNFLRDSTTGKYDESKDKRGGTIREAPPGAKVNPAAPPTA